MVAELGCICVVLGWVWLVPSDVTGGGMCVVLGWVWLVPSEVTGGGMCVGVAGGK